MTFFTNRVILLLSKAKALTGIRLSAPFCFPPRAYPPFGENRGLSERYARLTAWARCAGFLLLFLSFYQLHTLQSGLRLLPRAEAVLCAGRRAAEKEKRTLAFFPRLCYNLCSFILAKRWKASRPSRMRTIRGGTRHIREGCRRKARRAASSPAHAPPPTTAERRGEPLPGAPVTAQREARPAGGAIRVEPWSGPAGIKTAALHPV